MPVRSLLIVLFVLILLADAADNGSAAETTWIVVAIVATFGAWAVHLFYAPLLMKRQGNHNGQTWGKQLCSIRVIRGKPEHHRAPDVAAEIHRPRPSQEGHLFCHQP